MFVRRGGFGGERDAFHAEVSEAGGERVRVQDDAAAGALVESEDGCVPGIIPGDARVEPASLVLVPGAALAHVERGGGEPRLRVEVEGFTEDDEAWG